MLTLDRHGTSTEEAAVVSPAAGTTFTIDQVEDSEGATSGTTATTIDLSAVEPSSPAIQAPAVLSPVVSSATTDDMQPNSSSSNNSNSSSATADDGVVGPAGVNPDTAEALSLAAATTSASAATAAATPDFSAPLGSASSRCVELEPPGLSTPHRSV